MDCKSVLDFDRLEKWLVENYDKPDRDLIIQALWDYGGHK